MSCCLSVYAQGVDPTKPLVSPAYQDDYSVKNALVLQSVFVIGDQKTAIISDVEYQEGDLIDGVHVQHISGDKVVLSVGGVEKTLLVFD